MEHTHDRINKNNGLTPKTFQTKAVYLQDNRPSSILQKKANNTGLPDNLKSGIENLSGHAMDDVKVHYNSDKPAKLNAHAYAQGSEIHLASGQEKHLPHEAWHVVQQKQGRVKPTLQMKGKVNINDDKGLEKEADVMGGKAGTGIHQVKNKESKNQSSLENTTVQRIGEALPGAQTDPSLYLLIDHEEEGRAKNVAEWNQKVQEIQQLHVQNQQTLYAIINSPGDLLNLAQIPHIGLPVEAILTNTKEFLSQRLVVFAMTPTVSTILKPPAEMKKFWPQVPQEALKGELFFDDNVAYPNIGSSRKAAEGLRATDPGVIIRSSHETAHAEGMNIRVFMNNPLNHEILSIILMHEIQHVADRHDGDFQEAIINDINGKEGDVGNAYRSEFRAYWLGNKPGAGFGNPTLPASNSRNVIEKWWIFNWKAQPTNFANQRQENIFWHMVNSTTYPWVKVNYLQSAAFRNLVNGLATPSGGNLLNSIRIDSLRSDLGLSAMGKFANYVDDIINDAQALDMIDRYFLQSPMSGQFWTFFDQKFAGPFDNQEQTDRAALIKAHLEEIIGRR
ncbi:eCIS core domain-containing protein [Flavobacterium hydrophilum]|uniref:eCIS core domain-containing protein n=1 Tax=Flavobacterium hydrophilum TaxID=2211445 RepID=A0A2V4C619_9FLAO|nr:DUF4157 domain-containing protein [Flavobacterium hydrophilum]PXY46806.1 hypothetical protein DMB68_06520 [Flavobacterium hydrophilum]